MITEGQEKQLNNLVGIPKSYNGKNVNISKVKIITGRTNAVVFDGDNVIKNLLSSEIDDFIFDLQEPNNKPQKNFLPPVHQSKDKPIDAVVYNPQNEEMKNTLMETLQKLKTDPNYIPQANAMVAVVGQMINIQKTEIQMYNTLRK